MNPVLIFCAIVFCAGDLLAERIRFQKYRYDPWTGRTSSVEEFDEDVRNMDSRKLQRYMDELRRVKNGLEDMRRESDILERELGFGLGGFPSLMDNSESIIKHALDSVSDQLQRRIEHHTDPKQLQGQQQFDDKVRSADRPTLQRNLERLQQTKKEINEAKKRAEALKNELGFDFDRDALQRAESAVDHGMQVVNHQIQKLDHPHSSHPQLGNSNVTNTMKKVDNALQTADQQQLARFDNEFKKMRQYMDNVRSTLDNFHQDLGFEFDGIFEPFKMAESILNHGLNTISSRQLHGQGQAQGAFNQQNPAPGHQQQQGTQQNPPAGGQHAGYSQQNPPPPGGAQQQQQGTQQNPSQNQQYQGSQTGK